MNTSELMPLSAGATFSNEFAIQEQSPLSVSPSECSSRFPSKLYRLLESQAYPHLLRWAVEGTRFFILDIEQFTAQVLPHHFRHRSFGSFTRQLNFYGFRRRTVPHSTASFSCSSPTTSANASSDKWPSGEAATAGLPNECKMCIISHPVFKRDNEHAVAAMRRSRAQPHLLIQTKFSDEQDQDSSQFSAGKRDTSEMDTTDSPLSALSLVSPLFDNADPFTFPDIEWAEEMIHTSNLQWDLCDVEIPKKPSSSQAPACSAGEKPNRFPIPPDNASFFDHIAGADPTLMVSVAEEYLNNQSRPKTHSSMPTPTPETQAQAARSFRWPLYPSSSPLPISPVSTSPLTPQLPPTAASGFPHQTVARSSSSSSSGSTSTGGISSGQHSHFLPTNSISNQKLQTMTVIASSGDSLTNLDTHQSEGYHFFGSDVITPAPTLQSMVPINPSVHSHHTPNMSNQMTECLHVLETHHQQLISQTQTLWQLHRKRSDLIAALRQWTANSSEDGLMLQKVQQIESSVHQTEMALNLLDRALSSGFATTQQL